MTIRSHYDNHDDATAPTLERIEARYATLVEALDVGFCVIALRFEGGRAVDYRIIEANAAFERQSGLRDVVGRWASEIVPSLERHWYDAYGRVALTGEAAHFENEAEALGRWFAVHAFRVGDPAAGQVGVLFQDVSEKRQHARALQESSERLEEALSAGQGIGTWDWDVPGDLIRADERFARLYGVAPDVAARGAPIADFFARVHPDDLARLKPAIETALRTGKPFAEEYRLLGDDGGTRWIAARGRCRHAADGTPSRFPGTSFDITDRKRIELHQAALLAVGDRIRDIEDPDALAYAACEILGRTLDVSRVGYGIVDTQNETISIDCDWNAPGIRTIAGVLRFRDYGSYIEDLKRGETAVVVDARIDARTGERAEALTAISARAFVNMPLVEQGGFVALLYANNATTRPWADEELALMREVADRVRAASERLRAEAARRESEEQFRVFAQTVPCHIWASRPDGHLDWFNDQFYAYCGAERGALDGVATWAEFVHPEDLPGAAAAWSQALASGDVYATSFRMRRHDGAFRWFLARAEPVRASDGAIVRWVGTNTDVDESRRQAAALARLNDHLEAVVAERTRELNRIWSSTNDLMATAGLDGYLKAVNPAWTRMLGWSEAEILGRPFAELIDPDDHAETEAVMRRLGEGEAVADFVDRLIEKGGGQRVVMWDAVPDGDLFHIVGRDLTAQRRAEEQLRQSQKMEAVGQLTGGIAHDFNNLLTGISGSLEILNSRIAQGRLKDIERYATAAQGATKRAAALTHRLLAFSRRQTLDPKPTDVNRLVAGMEDMLRRTVGPAIAIEVVAAGGLWATLVDPNQLENALLNLCINARDAMPDGGRLTIETGNRWLDTRAARDRDLPPGQYVSLCVSDTGTGMTPEVVAKAFDPFFTTKPLGQGTGLGLSMIYGFTRQSGGQVRIYSEPGQGTMVCIYLPRHHGGAVEDGEASADLAEPHRATDGETVLVVDDEPTVRMLVAEILEGLGYAAIEAADGASGLKVLQSDARVDLLVTDVGLPGGMNGRQMADAARVLRPRLKVLFITGYAENAVVGNGQLDPGMHVMTKPFAMDALAARIKELIGGG